jgi:hypothetical protein
MEFHDGIFDRVALAQFRHFAKPFFSFSLQQVAQVRPTLFSFM